MDICASAHMSAGQTRASYETSGRIGYHFSQTLACSDDAQFVLVLQVPEELRGASRLYGVPYPFLDAVI